jgi:hypothetical protein
VALVNFVASFVLAVIGLFMNRVDSTYERLLTESDAAESGVGNYDRKVSENLVVLT